MNILFVVPWYETEEKPQAGTFFSDLAYGLVEKGDEVQVMFPRVAAGFRQFITGNYNFPMDKKGKVPVYYAFIPNVIPRIERLRPWLLTQKSYWTVQSIIQECGTPDLIHAHSVYRAGYIARKISKKYDIPYIISENFSVVARGHSGNIWGRMKFGRIYREAGQLIAVSTSLRDDLIGRYGVDEKEFRIIPNTVHELFYDTFHPMEFTAPPFRIHFTAFLRPVKRLDLLLRAIYFLERDDREVQLTVAGDGVQKKELEEQAEQCGIRSSVRFLGTVSRERIKRSIDRSHAVVSTSSYETFGVNLLEGLASGRPVIATDSGGPRDFINDQNGILVQDHTPRAVASAIRRMMKRYSSYDQESIRREIVRKYSSKTIISKLQSIYREVLTK